MWCTRWFLPLFLLPVPTTRPYFLVLYVISALFHAKPCGYCILIIASLFVSSCYWSAISLSAFQPASIATFNSTEQEALWKAGSIQLLSRCWCDFQRTPFFGYHNTTQWEIDSLQAAVDSMNITITPSQGEGDVTETVQEAENPRSTSSSFSQRWFSVSDEYSSSSTRTGRKWIDTIWRYKEEESNLERSTAAPAADNFAHPEDAGSASAPEKVLNLPDGDSKPSHWLRRKYDLRSHGIDLIVDFGWGGSD
ncbi:hypothetical protein FRC15_003309 [Serendipita sp. 397]|nr:hypothetical protein FRC15_003309 [Serendipita sp. 397]KAG8838508.1 hypothetical protein FRC18_004140 [Serendipita sp. 400]